MSEGNSENQTETSAIGAMALEFMKDPDMQKSLLDMVAPVLQTQEAVLSNVIESQNQINQLLVQLIEVAQTNQTKLDLLLKALATLEAK